MLRSSSAAAPRIVAAVCCVVERPIDESTAIQPERTYCAGGAAACCCDLHRRSPTIIPAERQRFSSPKVRHAPDKLYCRFHNVFSFRVKIIREIFKQLDRVLLRNGQRTHGNIQAAEIFEQNVQRVVLVFGKAVFHPHLFGGFGCDRDGQRNPRVAVVHIVVRITVWNVNGLRCRCDLAHIPKDLPQQLHTFFVECEHVYAVPRACRFGCEHGYDLAPIWGLSDDLNRRKIAVLQAFQLSMIFTLNFRDGGCQRNGIVALPTNRKATIPFPVRRQREYQVAMQGTRPRQ